METTLEKDSIINCHAHVMLLDDLPEKLFLGLPIVRWLKTSWKRELLLFIVGFAGWFLSIIGWDSLAGKLRKKTERFHAAIYYAKFKKPIDAFEDLKGFYPDGTQFALHALDTIYMDKGKVPQSFEKQLDGLLDIKQQYPGLIYPFLALNPRRKLTLADVRGYMEKGFYGIKLYPPHGYKPYDKSYKNTYPEFLEIYKFLKDEQIPIVAHCTPTGLVGDDYQDPGTGIPYTDPDNYKELLDEYGDLKICLAHFGGNEEWIKYLNISEADKKEKTWVEKIIDMIEENDENGDPLYPNLYVDISYTSFHVSTRAYLNVLLNATEHERLQSRILFGSDYPVVQTDIAERGFSIGIRGEIGEEKFDLIARQNPRVFLGI